MGDTALLRDEIVLLGPPFAGKSTLGRLLATRLGVGQASLDDLRWDYYREIGYDEALAAELRQKGGFLALALYWSQFNAHAIERLLDEQRDCVIDLGAGPIVFENRALAGRIERALAPFRYAVRLLPAADPALAIDILHERGSHLVGIHAQGFDWAAYFVNHAGNRRLGRHVVYTGKQSPEACCAEILVLAGRA